MRKEGRTPLFVEGKEDLMRMVTKRRIWRGGCEEDVKRMHLSKSSPFSKTIHSFCYFKTIHAALRSSRPQLQSSVSAATVLAPLALRKARRKAGPQATSTSSLVTRGQSGFFWDLRCFGCPWSSVIVTFETCTETQEERGCKIWWAYNDTHRYSHIYVYYIYDAYYLFIN